MKSGLIAQEESLSEACTMSKISKDHPLQQEDWCFDLWYHNKLFEQLYLEVLMPQP